MPTCFPIDRQEQSAKYKQGRVRDGRMNARPLIIYKIPAACVPVINVFCAKITTMKNYQRDFAGIYRQEETYHMRRLLP